MENDFGYDNGLSPIQDSNEPPKVDEGSNNALVSIDGDNVQYDENGNPITPIDNDKKEETKGDEKNDDDKSELAPGTELQIGEDVYKIDDKGNVVDSEGNIFKEAKDVKEWLESFDAKEDDDNDELSIKSIQKALDITITDENDKEVEFDNTPEGVKAYVEQVIESSREEHYQTAIQSLFDKYPFVEDMINYYTANGNSLEGYNEVPDRSGITLDENNEAQQEYIIKTAWKEQNRRGNVDSYIQYLKSTGNLFATAQEELEGLQESDKQYREEMRKQAEAAENERIENAKKYWNDVHDVIKSRQIAGYNIPESIVVTRDGKKTTATVEDFFKYVYQVDNKGKSRYNYDLEAEDPKARLQDDILRAFLKFTGGSYSNLVDMAINKKEVNKLILKSKENKKPSISIRKPASKNNNKTEIDLGFN